jgi:nitroreductase
MSVLETIKARRSIRGFTDEPIGEDVLEVLLDAGRWAPTSSTPEKWRFIVVSSSSMKELIGSFSPGIFGMPAAVVVICVERTSGESALWQFAHAASCTLAAQNIMLAAHEMGIGSCIAVSFSKAAITEALGIPEGVEPLFIVTLGYPAEKPEPPPRLDLGQIAFIDTYGRQWPS